MLKTRVIPCLLLHDGALVKSVRFRDLAYIGDPINAVRIFNELEVDELIFLDITASVEARDPDFDTMSQIADECFMPLSYGGGVKTIEQARRLLALGAEKVAVNTAAIDSPTLIEEISAEFGSQALIASIDVKKNHFGKYHVLRNRATVNTKLDPVDHAREVVRLGAGEILLTSVDKDGTWSGYDLEVIGAVAAGTNVPVIASGGAGTLQHLYEAKAAGAAALAVGSMVVYQRRGMGVLVNFPTRRDIHAILDGP